MECGTKSVWINLSSAGASSSGLRVRLICPHAKKAEECRFWRTAFRMRAGGEALLQVELAADETGIDILFFFVTIGFYSYTTGFIM